MGKEFPEQKEPEGLVGIGEGKERQGPSRGKIIVGSSGRLEWGVCICEHAGSCECLHIPQGEVAWRTPELALPFCWEGKQSKGLGSKHLCLV